MRKKRPRHTLPRRGRMAGRGVALNGGLGEGRFFQIKPRKVFDRAKERPRRAALKKG